MKCEEFVYGILSLYSVFRCSMIALENGGRDIWKNLRMLSSRKEYEMTMDEVYGMKVAMFG